MEADSTLVPKLTLPVSWSKGLADRSGVAWSIWRPALFAAPLTSPVADFALLAMSPPTPLAEPDASPVALFALPATSPAADWACQDMQPYQRCTVLRAMFIWNTLWRGRPVSIVKVPGCFQREGPELGKDQVSFVLWKGRSRAGRVGEPRETTVQSPCQPSHRKGWRTGRVWPGRSGVLRSWLRPSHPQWQTWPCWRCRLQHPWLSRKHRRLCSWPGRQHLLLLTGSTVFAVQPQSSSWWLTADS